MNRELSRMARRTDVLHDVDCIYRNTAKRFWCAFEWKYPGEQDSAQGTMNSFAALDMCFSSDQDYKGLFLVRLGTSLDEFAFDDTQQCTVQHLRHGVAINVKTYTTGAKTAIQYILDNGRLL